MTASLNYQMKFIAVLILFALPSVSNADDKISFNRDVRPILSDRCFHCHGPDSKNQDSEFRLDNQENALADLGGYFGIVPGNLDKSELHKRIRSKNPEETMPPPEAVRQLTDGERDVLDKWIKQGAEYDVHWSFKSIAEKTDVPKSGKDWAKNEIDRFIFEKFEEKKFSPTPETTKERWLRRVTFDVIGLPPTLEQIDQFLADQSNDAYEKVVDRLLKTDAYAERMTSEWLDVARYSDSYGYQRDDARYVWPYRDWVLRAFQKNMPYDQFIKEQLAGDLIPFSTKEQKLATTFNRLHSHKKEGGSVPEEFRIEYVADRTNTVAYAFMGLTFECARCHDHKYDPIKAKEYYQLGSFFSNIDEYGLISYFTDAVPTPALLLPTAEQQDRLSLIYYDKKNLDKELAQEYKNGDGFQKWLHTRSDNNSLSGLATKLSFEKITPKGQIDNLVENAPVAKTNKANTLVEGREGKAIQLTGDDSVTIPKVGHFRRDDPFSISVWIKASEKHDRAVIVRRSRAWDDAASMGYELILDQGKLNAKLVHFWPGNAICVEAVEPLKLNEWQHVVLTYDGSSRAAGLKLFVQGNEANQKVIRDGLTRQIREWKSGQTELAIGQRFRDRGFKNGLVDDFEVYNRQLSELEVQKLHKPSLYEQKMSVEHSKLSKADIQLLEEYFLLAESTQHKDLRTKVHDARKKFNDLIDEIPEIMTMREMPGERVEHILERGAYDAKGEKVTAGTPSFLPAFPKDQPVNRLGLSNWLTASNHPLTSRVVVNRYWQMFFGSGLVSTPEDFGSQGQPPTHPELLDWLSRDFMNHNWNVHHLVKKIVLSSTYRQVSDVPADVRKKDPENVYLSRGTKIRLTAEMIRDNALAVSGLMVDKFGGPPVKPYEVNFSFKPLKPDKGEGLYRRSLYTWWQRTSPAPVMMTLNASKREVCRVKRDVTASPLQAFVLMNGPQFVEASRVLAEKLIKKNSKDVPKSITESFRLLTGRTASERETKILLSLYEEQLDSFQKNSKQAAALLKTGNAPQDNSIPKAEHAAMTVLVNSIMNLDESVRKQ